MFIHVCRWKRFGIGFDSFGVGNGVSVNGSVI